MNGRKYFAAALLLTGCNMGHAVNPAEYATPRFDWLEYSGNDSIYKLTARGANQFYNPILPGFYPDPSIAGLNGDYYLVTSSFAYFPGVPLFHSKDLAHWTQVGSILDRPSQLPLANAGISRGIFAPAIRYNPSNRTWYMLTTNVDNGGNFFVTAKDPKGPWSEPVWLKFDGIDPSFFFDDNGKAWVVNNGPPIETPRYSGHRAIWIQEFDVASGTMVGPRSLIINGGVDLAKNPIWIEAPHIFKRNGFYYLICAEGGTADQHSEVVFRGPSVMGPWVASPITPILTQRHLGEQRPFPVTSTGHADFVDTPSGETWAVFLGTRPYTTDTYNIGRETFMLPVKWVNDWPMILAGNELVSYAPSSPKSVVLSDAKDPYVQTGNFTIREEFNGPTLPPYWQTMRAPAGDWLDLTSTPGSLTLRPRSVGLEPSGQPSWVGRRQQHLNSTVITALRYAPPNVGDKAGVMLFQNEQFYYLLAVTRTARGVEVEVERHGNRRGANAPTGVIESRVLRYEADAPVYLRIDTNGGTVDFSVAVKANEWIPLVTKADGSILSTKVASGFVGSMYALYAYSPTGSK